MSTIVYIICFTIKCYVIFRLAFIIRKGLVSLVDPVVLLSHSLSFLLCCIRGQLVWVILHQIQHQTLALAEAHLLG